MSDPFSTFLNTSMSIRQQHSVQGSSGHSDQLWDSVQELLRHLWDQVEERGELLSDPQRVRALIGRAQDAARQSPPDLVLLRTLLTQVSLDVAALPSLVAITSSIQALIGI